MKVLMIGAGDIARSHARAVVKLGGSIVGAYDVNAEGLRSFAKEFDCDQLSYEQIPEYVERAEYAVISTPPTKRLDYCEMVLSRHVPLYLEKPIATTMEDALKIVDMAKKYDAKIIVGFAHRYRPAFVKMHELVASGMFGEPVNVFSYRVGPGFGYGKNNAVYGNSWRTDPKLACGMTIESVSHDWKLITAMAGSFETISCNYTGTLDSVPRFDNHTSISARLKNGAIATIAASWACDIPTCSRAYIGDKGSIFLTGEGMFEFTDLTWKTEDMPYAETLRFNDSYDHATGDVIFYAHEAFQDCLINNKPIETPLSDGISALRYSLAAKKSSEEHITVRVPEWGADE